MPQPRANLADRSGSLVEAHTFFQPRVFFFHLVILALLLTLAGGLAYQQLFKTDTYHEAERVQNQRRILVPGPRGNLYDRDGRLLVGNRPRFAVVLYLDELRTEFRREYIQIRKNYREADDKDMPSARQMERIARTTVVQRYLDQVNQAIGRTAQVDATDLLRHFSREMLLPYTLIDDLAPEEYAHLIEHLPVRSPLQVYASSTRSYPYHAAAAHTLGFVSSTVDVEAENLPGGDLTTFKMKGTVGKDGIEQRFDANLQGQAGGTIFRVDPAGYRINPPLEKRLPVQGKNLTLSLDIDLQQAAENALTDLTGAAVAIEVNTGEVLVLASLPSYDLTDFTPRLTFAKAQEIAEKGAWPHRAIYGAYPPGSTFKLITALAGLRTGILTPESIYETNGAFSVGRRVFRDHAGCRTGEIDFRTAIEQSVNTYFFNFGLQIGAENLAAEARRFHLHEKTGIELPNEGSRMIVPDAAWKKKTKGEPWYPGDTANFSIGQGDMQVTPLQMACFLASLARGQTQTTPTLLHQAGRPPQRSEPIGLPAEQYQALIEGMERVITAGTARKFCAVPGLRIAGKTGTAQRENWKDGKRQGMLEIAWFVGFAPVEHPEIAIAVMVEGDTPDESYAGGAYAAPVARAIFQKWLEKKNQPATAPVPIFKPVLPRS